MLFCLCLPPQADLNAKVSKLSSEREFLKSLNDTLLANQKQFQQQLTASQNQLQEKDAELKDMQEQVSLEWMK